MTYALVGHTFFKGAPNGGVTPPIDTTGADLIVINTSPNDVGGPTTPTDSKGNVYTLIISMNELQAYSQLWYCKHPVVGPNHTFSSVSGTTNFMGLSVIAFSGSTANPFNAAVGNDGRLPNPPFNGSMKADGIGSGLLPGASDALVVCAQSGDIHLVNAPGGFSIDSGFTITDTYFQESFVCLSGGLAYQIQTVPTLVNPKWTANGWTGAGSMAVTMATFVAFVPAPKGGRTRIWGNFKL
jgi:hypothetical protein